MTCHAHIIRTKAELEYDLNQATSKQPLETFIILYAQTRALMSGQNHRASCTAITFSFAGMWRQFGIAFGLSVSLNPNNFTCHQSLTVAVIPHAQDGNG